MPEIHLLVMFGIAVDFDLIPYFIDYYKRVEGITHFHVNIHLSGDKEKDERAVFLFTQAGYIIEKVLPYDLEMPVTADGSGIKFRPAGTMIPLALWPDVFKGPFLNEFRGKLPLNAYILPVDSDEMQEWDRSPAWYVNEGYDAVLGKLWDRYGKDLQAPDPKLSLKENYPYERQNLSALWRHPPMIDAKYLLFKNDISVIANGYHELGEVQPRTLKLNERPLRVLHYRWRDTLKKRVEGRLWYYDYDYEGINRFFGLSGSKIVYAVYNPVPKFGDFMVFLPFLKALREWQPNCEIKGIFTKVCGDLALSMGLCDGYVSEAEFLSERNPVHAPEAAFLFPCSSNIYALRIFKKYGARNIVGPKPFKLGGLHFTEEFLDYAESLGIPPPASLSLSPFVKAHYKPGSENVHFAFFHPGSAEKFKCMPPQFFVELAAALHDLGYFPVCVIGPDESHLEKIFISGKAAICKAKDLITLAEEIKSASLYIGHDSGGTHMAALLDVATICIQVQPPKKEWLPVGEDVTCIYEENAAICMEKVARAAKEKMEEMRYTQTALKEPVGTGAWE